MSADDIILLFQILYVVTALGTMVVVISENRNPVKTISWVLILMLLPLVGLIVYYFFGEDNRKIRLISHKTHKKFSKLARKVDVLPSTAVPTKYEGLVTMLNRKEDAPLYGGSKVKFYRSGKDKFKALFQLIREATDHIHIQYYIFMDDRLGTALSELLMQKAKEGVEVRLIYDDVGSWDVKRKFFKNMVAHGVQVQSYLPVKFRWLTSRVNYRNHRKLVIVDGKVGFLGGMNVADRYIDGVYFGVWRDSHLRLEGQAVAGLQSAFLIDWYSATGEILLADKYYPKLEIEGSSMLQIVTGGPIGSLKPIHIGVIEAVNTARKNLFIQTPYFIPTDGLMLAIQMAATRGVDVRLMVPKKSDTKLVHVASMSFLEDVMHAGASVYLFDAGFLHSKLMVVDDDLTITGSANMDVRSFEHNFEINAFIYDKVTNLEARDIFNRDLENSEKVILSDWKKRSHIRQFFESLMRLFSPLL